MTTGTAAHLTSTLELAPLDTAAGCARLHAVHVLAEWGLRELAEDAALVVRNWSPTPLTPASWSVSVHPSPCGCALTARPWWLTALEASEGAGRSRTRLLVSL